MTMNMLRFMPLIEGKYALGDFIDWVGCSENEFPLKSVKFVLGKIPPSFRRGASDCNCSTCKSIRAIDRKYMALEAEK